MQNGKLLNIKRNLKMEFELCCGNFYKKYYETYYSDYYENYAKEFPIVGFYYENKKKMPNQNNDNMYIITFKVEIQHFNGLKTHYVNFVYNNSKKTLTFIDGDQNVNYTYVHH